MSDTQEKWLIKCSSVPKDLPPSGVDCSHWVGTQQIGIANCPAKYGVLYDTKEEAVAAYNSIQCSHKQTPTAK